MILVSLGPPWARLTQLRMYSEATSYKYLALYYVRAYSYDYRFSYSPAIFSRTTNNYSFFVILYGRIP